MVKISQNEMMMKPRRKSCISLSWWLAFVDIQQQDDNKIPSSNSSALPIRSPDEEQREGNGDTVNNYRAQVGETSASSNRETDQVASAKAISSS